MGYQTCYNGHLDITPPLTKPEYLRLANVITFWNSDNIKLDAEKDVFNPIVAELTDTDKELQGEGGNLTFNLHPDHVGANEEPIKAYHDQDSMPILARWLDANGHQLAGEVGWSGDDSDDRGTIYAEHRDGANHIEFVNDQVSNPGPSWKKVQVLDSPAEAQQHQTENLVATLLSGKTMEGANLQDVKNQLSVAAHGITAAEAWKTGICVECRQPAAPKCHTPEGHGEYRISGLCEECFDEICADPEESDEEARWPICPECLASLDGTLTGDDQQCLIVDSVCPECNLEFGVKSTEEEKPIES